MSRSWVAKYGSVGQLELPHALRLQAVRAPDALHRGDANPGNLGHRAAGPLGRLATTTAIKRSTSNLTNSDGRTYLAARKRDQGLLTTIVAVHVLVGGKIPASSAVNEYRDLGMREYLDSLAAEDDGRDAATAV